VMVGANVMILVLAEQECNVVAFRLLVKSVMKVWQTTSILAHTVVRAETQATTITVVSHAQLTQMKNQKPVYLVE
jgi:hypothetical protein